MTHLLRHRRVAAALSVAVGLVTVVAAMAALLLRTPTYESVSQALITPAEGSGADSADTLSRGVVVATFAEAWAGAVPVGAALTAGGLGPAEREEVSVTSQVVAGTTIIEFTATSRRMDLAERAAAAIVANPPRLTGYSEAFTPQVLEPGTTASRAGPPRTLAAAAAVLLGLVTGGLYFWAATRRRRQPRSFPDETSSQHDEERRFRAMSHQR